MNETNHQRFYSIIIKEKPAVLMFKQISFIFGNDHMVDEEAEIHDASDPKVLSSPSKRIDLIFISALWTAFLLSFHSWSKRWQERD